MRLSTVLERLARAQAARPWAFLAPAALVTVLAAVLASGLQLDTSYFALVPEDAPEVVDANLVRERTGGNRQLVIAIEGDDPADRLALGRELVPLLRRLPGVRLADVEFPLDFFEDRAPWLLDLATLDRLVPAVEEAVRLGRWHANPLALHLDEEAEREELEAAWKEVEDIVSESGEPPLEETLTSGDGRFTFLMVTPRVRIMDVAGVDALFGGIDAAVASLDPASRGLSVRTTGKYTLLREAHQVTSRDLRRATLIALVLGVLLVALFTRRPAAPLIVAAGLVTGVLWTLAVARLLLGRLNIITGFLVAVLIGLGIDFGIHLVMRHREEIRRGSGAVARAVAATFPPSLTGALTTSGAFLSFTIARFRGFTEFGLLAGIGVVLALVSTFVVIPPILALAERRRGPLPAPPGPARERRIPLPAAIVAATLLAGWAAYGALGARSIPFVNDYTLLRHVSDNIDFFEYVDGNVGLRFDPAVILVDDADDARRVESLTGGMHASRVLSAANLVPRDVEAHAERISTLRDLLLDPRLDPLLEEGGEDADRLERARRMIRTEPWGVSDLPDAVRLRLTTLDGRGLVVLVWPEERIDSDVGALAWERELEGLRARLRSRGIDHTLSTETLMPAWVHRMIVADSGPLLTLASLVVLLFIFLHLRSVTRGIIASLSLAAGILGFLAVMRLTGWELNMFNLIVIPAAIGIGIDDVIHVLHRYGRQGRGSIVRVLRRTGAAVLLTSLTTGAGFGSILVAHHPGLRSVGSLSLAAIGFTLLSAVVFLPALVVVLEALRRGP